MARGRTKRFLAVAFCQTCQKSADVYYTATWNDPIFRKLAIAKSGWREVAGTGSHICPDCCEKHDQ